MRFFASFLLTAAVAAGCGETAASTVLDDAGSDASTQPDGGFVFPEGGLDGGGPDGGVDGGTPDASVDGGTPDGGGSWCETSKLCPQCPDEDKLCDLDELWPPGEACWPTGCGGLARWFVTGGGACTNDADCGNPAYVCEQTMIGEQTIKRCVRLGGGCDDSNDCVAGFACEDGACTDRRVPCEVGSDCPHGYTCFFPAPDQRFCRRISRPCDDDVDCLSLGYCGDADGDGAFECTPSRMPDTPNPVPCDNMDCPDKENAPVCESNVQGTAAVCGEFGLCASSDDCAMGFECRDLWGDGRKECVLPNESCVDSSVCAPREVCASPRSGAPPRCIGDSAI